MYVERGRRAAQSTGTSTMRCRRCSTTRPSETSSTQVIHTCMEYKENSVAAAVSCSKVRCVQRSSPSRPARTCAISIPALSGANKKSFPRGAPMQHLARSNGHFNMFYFFRERRGWQVDVVILLELLLTSHPHWLR